MSISDLHRQTARALVALLGENEARDRTKSIYELLKSNDAFYSLAKFEFTSHVLGGISKNSPSPSDQQNLDISKLRDIVCMKMLLIEDAKGTKFVDDETFRETFLAVLEAQITKIDNLKNKGGRHGL